MNKNVFNLDFKMLTDDELRTVAGRAFQTLLLFLLLLLLLLFRTSYCVLDQWRRHTRCVRTPLHNIFVHDFWVI